MHEKVLLSQGMSSAAKRSRDDSEPSDGELWSFCKYFTCFLCDETLVFGCKGEDGTETADKRSRGENVEASAALDDATGKIDAKSDDLKVFNVLSLALNAEHWSQDDYTRECWFLQLLLVILVPQDSASACSPKSLAASAKVSLFCPHRCSSSVCGRIKVSMSADFRCSAAFDNRS